MDTANLYSYGKSEEILGEAMEGRRQLIVATKLGFPMGKGVNDHGLSRFQIIKECEASLKRLRTAYRSLPDASVGRADAASGDAGGFRCARPRRQGALHRRLELFRLAPHEGDGNGAGNHFVPIVSQQIYYSLELRDAEYELIPITLDQGLGVLIWSPLAGGLLSGKYRRGKTPEEGGRHLNDWHEPPIYNQRSSTTRSRCWWRLPRRVAFPRRKWRSPGCWAGRASRRRLRRANRDQLRKNLRSADLTLTAEERSRLDGVSQQRLLYPYLHQCPTAAARLGPADWSLIGPHLG